jgi:hypothetical protein
MVILIDDGGWIRMSLTRRWNGGDCPICGDEDCERSIHIHLASG